MAAKLPEFSSQQGQLLTSDQAQPYIQKTDLLVLAYDPADQLTIDQVPSRNRVPQAKILVQSKQIQVDIMGITAGQDYGSLPFEFNSHHLASLIREATQARLSNYLLVFLSLFIFAYLRFALISFFTSLIAKILLADQKKAWSVTLLAMTTPLCILSLINLFLGLLPFQDAILIAVTLFRVRQLKNLRP
ncbi:DUF1189 family protein [Aerococcus urinaehominis]|uniref:DUF1189 family protein n=1 Tax=Aerococcus urinaehominis TaxID=128944 RepID=UPI001F1C231E|nr:DUF1189 family protein [Aerococcus urinaehominis]